jgi:hypothetical protein
MAPPTNTGIAPNTNDPQALISTAFDFACSASDGFYLARSAIFCVKIVHSVRVIPYSCSFG